MKPFQSFRDRELLREELQLRREIEQTRDAMDAARSRFEAGGGSPADRLLYLRAERRAAEVPVPSQKL